MNCAECQLSFSDFVEKALAPIAHESVTLHVAGCTACRKELRDFRRALQILRAAKPEEPPAGLKEAVLAKVSSTPVAVAVASSGKGARRRRSWRLWGVAAAALLLFAAAFAAIFSRENSLRLEVARRQTLLDARVAEGSREATRLQGEIERVESAALEERRLSEESFALEARRRQVLEQRSSAFEARVRSLEEDLARGQKETALLVEKLTVAEESAARFERELARAKEVPAPEEPKALVAAPEVERHEPLHRPRTVLFRNRGGNIELSVRGAREEVVPELLQIARDDSNPEMSDLALNALENLIATPERSDRPPPGNDGWWNRRIHGFANVLGALDPAPEATVSPEVERAERLKVLEEAWRALSNSSQE